MEARGDDRAQAVQIGAVLLFGILIISFATYQAFVVPNQNRQVEFDHSQAVQGDLQELRNAIVSMAGDGTGKSVSITMGTRYPSRLVAINPGPVVSSLRTDGTTDGHVNVSVDNATTTGETGDFWSGRAHNYTTGSLVYRPQYNVYDGAPVTVYENTALVNEFRDGNVTIAGQRLLSGNRITLVTLNGSLSRSRSGTTSVDVSPVSASTRTVAVTNESAGENVTIRVPTRTAATSRGSTSVPFPALPTTDWR